MYVHVKFLFEVRKKTQVQLQNPEHFLKVFKILLTQVEFEICNLKFVIWE